MAGKPRLPFVRLHGGRHYRHMASLLEAEPEMRLTVSWVPCLVEQLAALTEGARDHWQTGTEVRTCSPQAARDLASRLTASFPGSAALPGPERLVDPPVTMAGLRSLAARHAVAWTEPSALAADPAAAAIAERLERVSRVELVLLHELGRRLSGEAVPAFRRLASSGRVELATTPLYHPILPLLLEPEACTPALAGLPPPELEAAVPSAAGQLAEAMDIHRAAFGKAPQGLWPPEMAVSPALPKHMPAGLRWLCTDIGLAGPSGADPVQASLWPHWVDGREGAVAVFFRDRELSDRIGFDYARLPTGTAVLDFVAYAAEAQARGQAAAADDGRPVLVVALDGENPWESYPDAGREFLGALYRRLVEDPRFEPVTLADYLDANPPPAHRRLPSLGVGSWVRGELTTWAGHPDQNAAWAAVSRARRDLGPVPGAGVQPGGEPGRRGRAWLARRSLWAAEGSDWFWWRAPDRLTPLDTDFRNTFLRHLENVYIARGLQPSFASNPT